MKTTLSLSDDILLIARQVATRGRMSPGEAVSLLARDGLRAQTPQPATKAKRKNKYSALPERDEIITNEHVRRLMDEKVFEVCGHLRTPTCWRWPLHTRAHSPRLVMALR